MIIIDGLGLLTPVSHVTNLVTSLYFLKLFERFLTCSKPNFSSGTRAHKREC